MAGKQGSSKRPSESQDEAAQKRVRQSEDAVTSVGEDGSSDTDVDHTEAELSELEATASFAAAVSSEAPAGEHLSLPSTPAVKQLLLDAAKLHKRSKDALQALNGLFEGNPSTSSHPLRAGVMQKAWQSATDRVFTMAGVERTGAIGRVYLEKPSDIETMMNWRPTEDASKGIAAMDILDMSYTARTARDLRVWSEKISHQDISAQTYPRAMSGKEPMLQEPELVQEWVKATAQHDRRVKLDRGRQILITLGKSTRSTLKDPLDGELQEELRAELEHLYGSSYKNLLDTPTETIQLEIVYPIANLPNGFPSLVKLVRFGSQPWSQASAIVQGPSIAYLLRGGARAALELTTCTASLYGLASKRLGEDAPNLDKYLDGHDGLSAIDLICRIQYWASSKPEETEEYFQEDHPHAWRFLCSNLCSEPDKLARVLPGLPDNPTLDDICAAAEKKGCTLPFVAQRKWEALKEETREQRKNGTLPEWKRIACDALNAHQAKLRQAEEAAAKRVFYGSTSPDDIRLAAKWEKRPAFKRWTKLQEKEACDRVQAGGKTQLDLDLAAKWAARIKPVTKSPDATLVDSETPTDSDTPVLGTKFEYLCQVDNCLESCSTRGHAIRHAGTAHGLKGGDVPEPLKVKRTENAYQRKPGQWKCQVPGCTTKLSRDRDLKNRHRKERHPNISKEDYPAPIRE